MWPAEIRTLAGDTATAEASLLTRRTFRFVGAGTGNVMANGAVCPSPTDTPEGMPILPKLVTVTFVVALLTFGALVLAVIVAEPPDEDVIGTLTLVTLSAMVVVAGTEATDGALELRFTARPPAGAGAERVNVTFCVMAPEINTVAVEKLSEPAT